MATKWAQSTYRGLKRYTAMLGGAKFVLFQNDDGTYNVNLFDNAGGPGKLVGKSYTYGLAEAKRVAEARAAKVNPRSKRSAVKRNPLSADYEAGLKRSREIGIRNAEEAIDQKGAYPSVRAAYAAYIVNAIDMIGEERLPGREAAVQAFLDHIAKPRKRRK